MIYLLLLSTIVLLMMSYIKNGRDLMSPDFLFSASFCFAALWAVVYADRWELGLHGNTFGVIIGGVTTFILVSWSTATLFKRINSFSEQTEAVRVWLINIQQWKLLILLILETATIGFTLYSLVKIMGTSSVMDAVHEYDRIIKFTDDAVQLPRIVRWPRLVCIAAGFWISTVIAYNYAVLKKVNYTQIIILALSMVNAITFGGRTTAVYMLVILIISYVIISMKIKPKWLAIKPTTVLCFIIIAFIILVSFKTVANLIGRNVTRSLADYLSIYCGAEIKNLDMFLQEPRPVGKEWGSQTFVSVIQWIRQRMNLPNAHYQLDIPFRKVGDFSLGNVYTTFYSYIYDFGYFGMVILTALMAFLTQTMYEKIKRLKLDKGDYIWVLIYAYVACTLVFSFFSNKFYEMIISWAFIRYIIIWLLLDAVFRKYSFIK